MSNLTFAIIMTHTIEYEHEFEMNEAHAKNAINKYGSMLEYKKSKNDLNRALFGNRRRAHETERDSYNDSEWTRSVSPDAWSVVEVEREPKSYEVTIRGTVTKTISVAADSEDQANERARESFTMNWDEYENSYNEETLHIEVVE
tara:strand:- start:80 stop:514 length:435 start_codon:yes stop_codon:yes gene_type:complete